MRQVSDSLPTTGRKRRFGLAGIGNVIATNLLLQAMLATNLFSTGLSTLASQLFNGLVGYAIYGKLVFRSEGLRHATPMSRYGTMMVILWVVNWLGIHGLNAAGVVRGMAALTLVLPLAGLSYHMQKTWVFTQR